MTDTAPRTRPLSPHLQVYRLPLAAYTSILHRITGFGLAKALVIATWWLLAVASGPEAYSLFYTVAKSIVGQIVLFLILLAAFYHTLNGIRHLCWDMVMGIDKVSAHTTSYAVLAGALAAALFTWFCIF